MTADKQSACFQVSLANEQSQQPVNERQLIEAVQAVLQNSSYESAVVSLAIVDDATIHELNRQYLNHDYATDVLSFVLDDEDSHLEGEVILSADTAAANAGEFGWPAAAEQLLYVVHGTLHLIGYDDKTPEEAAAMRAAESEYLNQFGFKQPTASVAHNVLTQESTAHARRAGGER